MELGRNAKLSKKILNGSNDIICNNECLCGIVPENNLRKIY